MNDPGVVGIGCFAKPEILSRVLRKMVEGYILGNLEEYTEKIVAASTTNLRAGGLNFRPKSEKAKARQCFNRCGCNPAAAGFENNQSMSSDFILLLKAVIGDMSGNQQTLGSGIIDSLTGKKITGFFLAMENEGLNLSVFTREGRLTSKKISAKLGVLTQIRKKRLH
jgi:hypothetical protein